MLMDLNDALDPDICEPFTLLRYKGGFVPGGFQDAPQTVASFGVISTPNGEELSQVPEGDRVQGSIVVHTQAEIKETNPEGTSDVVQWNGQTYRVIKVWPYVNRNYYKAFAVRMSGV